MAGHALQLPYRTKDAARVGPRLFRKQVLPLGSITYKGRRLDFTRPYLERLVQNFKQGAYAQVPFLLATDDNRHTMDPDRFRGEVKGLELADDGLDAVVELSDEGAKIIRDNPRLGVSARLVEQAGEAGPSAVPAIQHVLGTLDPRVTGMRDWEAISSDLAACHDALQVVDLTQAHFDGEHTDVPEATTDTKLTEEHLEKLKALPEDKQAAVLKLLDAEPAEPTKDDPPKEESDSRTLMDRLLGRKKGDDEPTDQEVKDAVEELLKDTDTSDTDREPAAAALSQEAQAAIDLANTNAATATKKADEALTALRAERFKSRKQELVRAGVPPADVDLARPLLEAEDDAPIDLSNGEKTSAREIVEKLLDGRKGTVDLSAASGSAEAEADPERAEAAKVAEEWEKAENG